MQPKVYLGKRNGKIRPFLPIGRHTTSPNKVMFLVVLACLSVLLPVREQDYLQSNERICMKRLLEVFLGPRNSKFNMRDDQNQDQIQDSDFAPDRVS